MKKLFSSFHICNTSIFAFLFSLTIILCSQSNVFAEGPSILSSDDDGQLFMEYSVCERYTVNDRYIVDCGTSQNVEFNNYDSIYNSDTGEYQLLWRYPITSSSIGPDKYLVIRRLTYYPGISVASGSNIFFRIENATVPIYLGTAREFFTYQDYGNRYQYNLGGLNSYIFYNRWNDMYSCPDMDSSICQFNFTWNTITGLGSTFRVSNAFTLPNGWQSFTGIDILHNLYDRTNTSYEWTPYPDNSVLYFINTQNDLRYMNGDYYVAFETNFNITSEYYDMNATAGGVDVNDVLSQEHEMITEDLENALDQVSYLDDININASLPFTNWFSLFTDNSCVDLTTIPSWFNLPSQHLCSPWNSTIRSTLTPIISVASTMLLFGFIISYLRGRNDGSVIDSVKGTWYG